MDETPEVQPAEAPIKTPLSKRNLIIAGCFFVLVIIPLILLLVLNLQKKDTSPSPQPNSSASVVTPSKAPEVIKLAPATLVFGVRSGQNAILKTYNLATEKTSDLISLNANIKNVSIFSPQSLIFIDQVDNNKLGKQIILMERETKDIIKSIHADEGFGIEDYILSPNKKYITTWEIKYPTTTRSLQGGSFRIYAIELSRPHIKNLLYDEKATPLSLIHYPIAILNSGRVFTDKLSTNKDEPINWAYGVSVSEFDGTNKHDIDKMQNGTYTTQPMFSPDGQHLLFVGYDGSSGDGTSLKDGVRQSILNPNTVELFDLETLSRQKLDLPAGNTYTAAYWDIATSNIVIEKYVSEKDHTELYVYKPVSKTVEKINLSQPNNKKIKLLSLTPTDKIITGAQNDSDTRQTKLGDNATPLLTEINVLDPQKPEDTVLAVKEPVLHYITTLPLNYFK